ncbi:hypothetical protein [Pedobacter sp. UC225_65]|uniref:hypothetical protein n=1 Tax=Pedobacter sp. UC225_65 TaxID=3350173 RepID=UPI00366B9EE6
MAKKQMRFIHLLASIHNCENIAARSSTPDAAADNDARYELVLIDGKLEVTCFKPNVIGLNAEIATYGVFSKVP